ncbi:hypothetical protein RhiirC2_788921 [Rhizophagus irregularis]|uniref:Uncharacterized protein n=1 Tax=Rhizophagus irregularis TaxID=588596 RepID=A0A2N1MPA6_9GLOM|nr:hypothetical protein RhiirC2_788921 [Rhizophagus irregularis]
MSGILGSITGILGSLFGNLIPSWEDLSPQPPELPETFEPPEPENLEEGKSELILIMKELAPKRKLPYRADPLATFENIKDQISEVYRRELEALE